MQPEIQVKVSEREWLRGIWSKNDEKKKEIFIFIFRFSMTNILNKKIGKITSMLNFHFTLYPMTLHGQGNYDITLL